MAAVGNIVEAAVEKAVKKAVKKPMKKAVKEVMGNVLMDTVDEIVKTAVQEAKEEMSERFDGLQSSNSSAPNNRQGPSIQVKEDPDAVNSLIDELNFPAVDNIRRGFRFRIYGESDGWHILGVDEMSNLTLESIQMTRLPSAFYEWEYDRKGDYARFYNHAMGVYLQAADCGCDEGRMTVGSDDHHNQFYITRDIITGKSTLSCVYQGKPPYNYTDFLDSVEIGVDGEGRLLPMHYRTPRKESIWKFKEVKKE